MASRIVIVDEDLASLSEMTFSLASRGFRIKGFEDVRTALTWMSSNRVDFLMTELHMARMNSESLLHEIRKIHPSLPCVFVSGFDLIGHRLRLAEFPDVLFLRKPVDTDRLVTWLCRYMKKNEKDSLHLPSPNGGVPCSKT